ncbi:LacI family DNA-binding transcriptional regulator [Staphylococcus gallinarum]|uniref:LacI family DNA-binding transcriptional regulator n=1 Tax=Staphylococcus gallinarum TaxID=1293 RepID=UPI001304C7E1|nr:LacI family DNA-binding transcriptional regulator [Staphylococcus gallinarum]MCD8785539.1 LacI family DNA-binding transcriptional regulator [Staphylococcus gallinarum]MCD8858243.1 LacI family DNA-binding transcriptional regulator [Staphylococcus gallinarum]
MEKKVTISDVAKYVGVSKSTVSQYINGNHQKMSADTREKIKKAIEKLNYRPSKQAQFLTTRKSNLIGVVVADISNMYSSLLLKGISQYFEHTNYHLIIVEAANSEIKEQRILQKLVDQNVEGIIIQPSNDNSSNYQFIANNQIPMILVDREIEDSPWLSVTTDNEAIVAKLMQKIVEKSYKNIIVVSQPIHKVNTREKRYNTIVDISNANKLNVHLIEVDEAHYIDIKQITEITKTGKTAIFALNGTVLLDIIKLINKNNLIIPNDIGITGFDDFNVTDIISPGITSINQPSKLIGSTVAELLDLILKGTPTNKIDVPTIIKSEIDWRHSL